MEYLVKNHLGKVIETGIMDADAGEVKILTLPPLEQNNEYMIALTFRGNAQGEISSSSPYIFLDAETKQYAREASVSLGCGITSFSFVAPLTTSTIGFSLELKSSPVALRGSTLGVIINDGTGKSLAQRRWLAPVGTVYNAEGELLKEADIGDEIWEFKIPECYQGETLWYVIFPVKWMRWRIIGLEDPRLSPLMPAEKLHAPNLTPLKSGK